MGSCSMLSAVWFKPEHRATATAVAYMGGKQAIHYLTVQEREGGGAPRSHFCCRRADGWLGFVPKSAQYLFFWLFFSFLFLFFITLARVLRQWMVEWMDGKATLVLAWGTF